MTYGRATKGKRILNITALGRARRSKNTSIDLDNCEKHNVVSDPTKIQADKVIEFIAKSASSVTLPPTISGVIISFGSRLFAEILCQDLPSDKILTVGSPIFPAAKAGQSSSIIL